jgi:hypothetical protein
MKFLAAPMLALALLSSPAAAFSVDMSFPNLTYPTGSVTTSTMNCTPTQTIVCPAQE